MFYLRYFVMFAYSRVKHMLCGVFCFFCLRFVYPIVASFSGLSICDPTFFGIL
jgi:hypothetical protein